MSPCRRCMRREYALRVRAARPMPARGRRRRRVGARSEPRTRRSADRRGPDRARQVERCGGRRRARARRARRARKTRGRWRFDLAVGAARAERAHRAQMHRGGAAGERPCRQPASACAKGLARLSEGSRRASAPERTHPSWPHRRSARPIERFHLPAKNSGRAVSAAADASTVSRARARRSSAGALERAGMHCAIARAQRSAPIRRGRAGPAAGRTSAFSA